ncbi:PAS domain-containing protein [Candidatus Peribacteria bacterium]|jgi:PAS domain S-box-containing protein|nr:PAS domain-containing protein [Candidatus Peribacteria bacterium]MBT4021580.1 PAS domain-containing protein [Candidatus Peribacteria bacterium]MBT4240740.1 PAS domain-containing protein [Candidatus Peribacteria bacterium]MBT4474294.1 PAS domain-containing protein [Candidatus Peribacteria bacterium]
MDILTPEQEKLLEQLEKHGVFRLAVKYSFTHTIITDLKGAILYANQATQRITGFPQQEIIGKTPNIWGGLMSKEYYEEMWNTIREKQRPFISEITNHKNTGEKYNAHIVISPIFNEEDRLIGFVGTEEEIS